MLKELNIIPKEKTNDNFLLFRRNSDNSFLTCSSSRKSKNTKNSFSTQKSSRKNPFYYSNSNRNLSKEDKLIIKNIKNFITISTKDFKVADPKKSIIKINHNLNFPSNEDCMSKIGNKTDSNFFKIRNISDIKREVKNLKNIPFEEIVRYKLIEIKELSIRIKSIQNKINILKNDLKINMNNNFQINNESQKMINQAQSIKLTQNCMDYDIPSIKELINEMKKQIVIKNSQLNIQNLILFKENEEKKLEEEDLNKMKFLIENTNSDIRKIKYEKQILNSKILNIQKEINKQISINQKLIEKIQEAQLNSYRYLLDE